MRPTASEVIDYLLYIEFNSEKYEDVSNGTLIKLSDEINDELIYRGIYNEDKESSM